MLVDCMRGDRRFGILFRPEGVGERDLSPGHVGCVAHIDSDQTLPDGTSNIVARGVGRFALERFVATPAPYHVGEVSDYDDEAESVVALVPAAARVRQNFERVGRAARTLADDGEPLPSLPDDPAELSFAIASLVDLDPAGRQHLLASRSPSGRLQEIDSLLSNAVDSLERRARVHVRARSNGEGPYASG